MEKRYLSNWSYNAALTLEELETLVIKNGGTLVSTWTRSPRKYYEITNRSLTAAIHEKIEMAERLESRGKTADGLRAAIAELEAIDNAPHVTPYADWFYISFTLDGFYYYYQVDRNPFFDFFYQKSPVLDGKTNKNGYLSADPKKWLIDPFLTWYCTQDQRKTAAAAIFELLRNAQPSRMTKDKRQTELFPLEESC